MDIRRKIELAEQAIRMVATHDAVDLVVIDAALQRLQQRIVAEQQMALERTRAKASEVIGGLA